jgi:hypothetical protein
VKHFQFSFSKSSSSASIPDKTHFTVPHFLNIPSIYNSDLKVIQHLVQMKSPVLLKVAQRHLPLFYVIFFNVSLLQVKFLALWKQVVVVPIFNRGDTALYPEGVASPTGCHISQGTWK